MYVQDRAQGNCHRLNKDLYEQENPLFYYEKEGLRYRFVILETIPYAVAKRFGAPVTAIQDPANC